MLLHLHIIIRKVLEGIILTADYINQLMVGYLGLPSTQRLLLPIILMPAMLFPLVHLPLFLQLNQTAPLLEVFTELPMVVLLGSRLLLTCLQIGRAHV